MHLLLFTMNRQRTMQPYITILMVTLTMLSTLVLHGSVGRHVYDVLKEVRRHEGWHTAHVDTPWSGWGRHGPGLARQSGSRCIRVLPGVSRLTSRSICGQKLIFFYTSRWSKLQNQKILVFWGISKMQKAMLTQTRTELHWDNMHYYKTTIDSYIYIYLPPPR